jgi:hypothetical protein
MPRTIQVAPKSAAANATATAGAIAAGPSSYADVSLELGLTSLQRQMLSSSRMSRGNDSKDETVLADPVRTSVDFQPQPIALVFIRTGDSAAAGSAVRPLPALFEGGAATAGDSKPNSAVPLAHGAYLALSSSLDFHPKRLKKIHYLNRQFVALKTKFTNNLAELEEKFASDRDNKDLKNKQ